MTEPVVYGHTKSGRPITDAMVNELAREAEAGYDIERLISRRGKRGRPSLGSAPASVESVRLDPELRRELAERASAEDMSTSEVIREALRRHLRSGIQIDGAAQAAAPSAPSAPKPTTTDRTSSRLASCAASTTSVAKRAREPGTSTRAQQAVAKITEQPGITASELAKSMDVSPNYLYRVLPRLAKEAKVVKHGRGYHPGGLEATVSQGERSGNA